MTSQEYVPEQEFWQFIMVLAGLKPGVLFQDIFASRIWKVLRGRPELSHLVWGSDLTGDPWFKDLLTTRAAFESYRPKTREQKADLIIAMGRLLGYPCSGDSHRIEDPRTHVMFELKPSRLYQNTFQTQGGDVEINGFVCNLWQIHKAKFRNLIEQHHRNLDTFFQGLGLGSVSVAHEIIRDCGLSLSGIGSSILISRPEVRIWYAAGSVKSTHLIEDFFEYCPGTWYIVYIGFEHRHQVGKEPDRRVRASARRVHAERTAPTFLDEDIHRDLVGDRVERVIQMFHLRTN
ncbi:hypothetical protein HK102_004088, partial [Quaeritorhiza haematococci]